METIATSMRIESFGLVLWISTTDLYERSSSAFEGQPMEMFDKIVSILSTLLKSWPFLYWQKITQI